MSWAHPVGRTGTPGEHLAYLQSMTRPYCGALWLLPGAGGTGQSMHPLMAWWAVLFTLSMLARYQPAEWAAHVDVDARQQGTSWPNPRGDRPDRRGRRAGGASGRERAGEQVERSGWRPSADRNVGGTARHVPA